MFKLINKFYTVVNRTIKVKDKAIWINVENQSGYFERICAFEGESLWHALKRSNCKIQGYCGNGSISSLLDRPIEMQADNILCSECMVYIDKVWFDKMERDEEIHYLENMELKTFNLPKGMRYACSVRVENWMDEMKIKLSQDTVTYGFYDDQFFDNK